MEHNIIQFRISYILDEMQHGGEDDCSENHLLMGNVIWLEREEIASMVMPNAILA